MSLLNWIIEGILIIVFVICIIRTVKAGMVKSLFRSCRIILAFVLSFVLNSFFAGIINRNWIGPWMRQKIYDMVAPAADGGVTEEALTGAVPEFFKSLMERFGTTAEEEATQALETENVVQSFSDAIAAPVSSILSAILAFAMIFVATILLSIVLGFLLDKVFHLPILRGINRIGGVVIGIFSGLCWVWALSHTLVFLAGVLSGVPYIAENFSLESSFLLRFFYEINPLQLLFRITH